MNEIHDENRLGYFNAEQSKNYFQNFQATRYVIHIYYRI